MAEEILKKEEGHICTLTINRPERKNALNEAALLQLGGVLNELKAEGRNRVVVLRGSGEKAFCAGVDLAGANVNTIDALQYCLESLINYPAPVIAMIFGYSIGAGLDLAVIADFRLAAENACFGANLVKLGRIYYYTAIQRLINLVGMGAAKEMLLTGRLINVRRAGELGLVNRVVSGAELPAVVYSLAREMAEENAPLAVKATKQMIAKLLAGQKLSPAVEEELKSMAEAVHRSKDAAEGPLAFIEKRKPDFKGE
ncbi:MAG: hypothetical protein C4589_06615 [Peptococcaceae bacterium]|nr:MAG: hypothetical protein C4589_06615 [Peptococcaceae bacterium]